MIDTELVVMVKHETETETRLSRWWVGIIDKDYIDLVKRQSVILCVGKNTITLHWKNFLIKGTAKYAALYREDGSLAGHNKFNEGEVNCAKIFSATLTWSDLIINA